MPVLGPVREFVQSFHPLRHTPARACVAALMGHRDVKTTLTVYAHLINTDDHSRSMAALGALSAPAQNPSYGNVIPLHG
jgi:integrase